MPHPGDKVGEWTCTSETIPPGFYIWAHATQGLTFSNELVVKKMGPGLSMEDAVAQVIAEQFPFDTPPAYTPNADVPIPKDNPFAPLPLDQPTGPHGAWVYAAPGAWFSLTMGKVPNVALGMTEYAVHGNQTMPKAPPSELPGYQPQTTTTSGKPPWVQVKSGWTTGYGPEQGTYVNHKHGLSVPKQLIQNIVVQQGLSTLASIKYWYEHDHNFEPMSDELTDELEFVEVDKLAKLNTWAWSHSNWMPCPPGRKPISQLFSVQHAVISEIMPTIRPDGKPFHTGGVVHPWAGVHFGRVGVSYGNTPVHIRTEGGWWMAPTGKVVSSQIPGPYPNPVTHVLVGAPKKPAVKPLTLEHAGVPHKPWPDSYRKFMTPRVAHDPLSFAVLYAQKAAQFGANGVVSEYLANHIDKWIGSASRTDDELDTECNSCGTGLLEDEGRFLCEACNSEYCLSCYDPTCGFCHGCNQECMCGASTYDGGWHCEWCGAGGICEDCIFSVSWKGAEYVCDNCYSTYAGKYGGKKGGIWADDGGRERGHSEKPPWEERGHKIDPKALEKEIMKYQSDSRPAWKEIWGFDDEDHDPVQVAADFYLLHPLQHNSLAPSTRISPELRVLSEVAGELRKGLIARYDDIFQRYVDMVIGGELRHHHCTREELPRARHFAWCGWQRIREKVGPDALADAAKLFREMGGGSIGGENWAVICDVLHLRATNRISPEVFIDRIFNIEHNGCTVLGAKVNWSGFFKKDYSIIKQHIGPAHAAHPARLDILAQFVTPDTSRIWAEYVPILNRERRVHGLRPIRRLPTREEVGNRGLPRWRVVSEAAKYRTVSVDDIRRLLTPDDVQQMSDYGECTALNTRLAEKIKSGEVKPYDI